jgi:HEAT repeat protein
MDTIGHLFVPALFLGYLVCAFLFSGREYWDPLLAGLRRWRQRPRFSLWRSAAKRAGLENVTVLDSGTRAALGRLVAGRLATTVGNTIEVSASVSHGALDVRVEDARLWGSVQLASEVIAGVVEAARRLVEPRDLAARIAENLRTEPEPGVRAECVAALARDFTDHPARLPALLAALEDADLEVRLRAAVALGPEGRDVLLAIAADVAAPDEAAARAVAALAADLPAEQAAAMLGSALRTRRLAFARECIRALADGRGPLVVPTLVRVLAVERGELAVAAASALGAAGSVAAESSLVAALENPAPEVRAAAAQALGRVGTTVAVPPLMELEENDRWCRAAARQAIAEIQSRVAGAGPGQLSLAQGESGELSIADGEAGALSLAGASPEGTSRSPGRAEGTQDTEATDSRRRPQAALGHVAKARP